MLAAAAAMTQPLPAPMRLAQLAAAEEELLLEVELNGTRVDEAALLLRSPDGRFHATPQSLAAWRLRVPAVPLRERAGTAWFPLDAIAGARVRYDAPRQQLAIVVPPEAFEPSRLDAMREPARRPAAPAPGAFVNYAIVASRAASETTGGAQVETGVFGPQGVVVAGLLVQRNEFARGATRLDTTYTRDFPGRLETLRVGDTVNAPGAWGRALRLGGVQWGSNFALQPGFVAYPTVSARGETALPSTVDVFVNNALVAQERLPPGPFSIANIPTVTGAGDVQLVVRDLLGREALISQPFYAASDLLAEGLAQYSIEVGAEREDFGLASFGYGHAVASAAYRRGLSSRLTAEARGEATRDHVAAGAAIDWLLGGAGVLSATAAASGDRAAGSGWLAGAGFSHQSTTAGATLRARWSSAQWRQAGVTEASPVPRVELAASASLRAGRFGSLNVAYVGQRYRDRRDSEFATVGWSLPLPGMAIGLLALRNFTERSTTLTAIVTLPFGQRDTASVGWTRQHGGGGRDDFGQLNVQRALPVGEGFGYRVYARSERDVQGSLAWQGPHGTYTAEATRFGDANGVRLSASGGLGVVAGHVFASREITESFGVIRVDDYDGVGILLENQPAARTGRGGYAVLPRLRAYDPNRIAIVPEDLPLDATIHSLRVVAVPSFRSGVLVDFPVRRSRGATLTIELPDGAPVPAGAVARIGAGEVAFPVGEAGLAYLAGLGPANRVVVQWDGQQCAFDVAFAAGVDPLPDLGHVVCRPLDGTRP